MRRSSTSRPILPADWTEVLERVQQALEQADAAAAKRAEALANVAAVAESGAPQEPPWRPGLEHMRQRLDTLSTYADRAVRAVAEADVALGAGEDSLRGWLQASEAARRKLAEWVGRAVG